MWVGHQESLIYMHMALGTTKRKRELPIAVAHTFYYTSHTQLNRLGFLNTGFHYFFSNSLFFFLQLGNTNFQRDTGMMVELVLLEMMGPPIHSSTTAHQNFLAARTTMQCGNLYPPHNKRFLTLYP